MLLGKFTIGVLHGLFWFRDLGNSGLKEETAALRLPFLVLLKQLAAHQPHERSIVGMPTTLVRCLITLLSR